MKLFLSIILIFIYLLSFSQEGKVQPIYQSYRKEPKSEFQFEKFTRGFDVKKINEIFDSLKVKEQGKWTFNDSLLFAVNLLKAEKKESSLKVFKKINPLDIESPLDFKYLITAYQINGYLKKASSLLRLYRKKFSNQINLVSAQERIVEFKLYLKNKEINKKWISANHILPLDFQNDSIVKDTSLYKRMLRVMHQYENELHFQTNFIFEEDVIIAAIATDLGLLLEKYFSYSQAYIAYSIARNYDKSNRFINDHLKNTRSYLNKNKYHLPIFRNYFPRKKKGRFELSNILKRIEQEKKEAGKGKPINAIRIREKDKYEKLLDNYDSNLIYASILLLVLILILILVRSKK